MRDAMMRIAFHEAGDQGNAAENVLDRADVKAGEDGVTEELAELQNIGTPSSCMTLSGVRVIGSNVLKKAKVTSVWRRVS
jgi:hypothetical protein